LAGSLGAIPFAPLARFTCRCSLPDDPTARDLVAVTDTGHALSPEPIPKALPRHDEPVVREDGPSRILRRLCYSVQHRRTEQVPTADGQIDQFFDLRQGARLVLELVVGRPNSAAHLSESPTHSAMAVPTRFASAVAYWPVAAHFAGR
jgi:hypothetical protein